MIPIVAYEERNEKLRSILSRQASFDPDVDVVVRAIIDSVREAGDAALREYTLKFDGVDLPQIKVPPPLLQEAYNELTPAFKSILEEAADNIRAFP